MSSTARRRLWEGWGTRSGRLLGVKPLPVQVPPETISDVSPAEVQPASLTEHEPLVAIAALPQGQMRSAYLPKQTPGGFLLLQTLGDDRYEVTAPHPAPAIAYRASKDYGDKLEASVPTGTIITGRDEGDDWVCVELEVQPGDEGREELADTAGPQVQPTIDVGHDESPPAAVMPQVESMQVVDDAPASHPPADVEDQAPPLGEGLLEEADAGVQVFNMGERVLVRDAEDQPWSMGTVTSVQPLEVRADDEPASQQWRFVEAMDVQEEEDERSALAHGADPGHQRRCCSVC